VSYVERLLTLTQGNVSQAARICGLERQALQQIMRRFGIQADGFRSGDHTRRRTAGTRSA
jgi:transcriptional regulator with GAF, ATPase, and Fis domain